MKKNDNIRKSAFYIIALLLPIVIWLGIETLANMITHRFDPLKVDRKKNSLYINQDYFTDFYLYDLEQYFNTSKSNRAIHRQKEHRFRILILGGSTTAGYPYNTQPEYECPASFANYLRAILSYNRNVPEIEVLNLGSNAFNSTSVLKVFDDIKKYDPNLVIVYSGHNEYFGPNEFALSKKSARIFENRTISHGFLAIRQTYLYQGLKWVLKKVLKRGEVEYKDYADWSMENTISYDDKYNDFIKNKYKRNLTALVRKAKAADINIVLCTPVSNLTFPPFASQHSTLLDAQTQARWDSLIVKASDFFQQEQYEDALGVWKQLYDIDSTYADVHYYTGMNYARLKEYEIANMALTKAADLDALPFRAKSYVNAICREVAKEENIILADCDIFYRQLSQKYYPEPSMLLDHVHPTEPGYYYLAIFIARTLVENNIFPGVKQIQYPDLEKTRDALGILDFVAYKVEFDFTEKSYLKQLSELNPAIKNVLIQIQKNAITQAKKIGQEMMKDDPAATDQKETNAK